MNNLVPAPTQPCIARMLHGYSIEIIPSHSKAISVALDRLHRGTEVFLTWIPGTNPMHMIAPATELRRSGFSVVPHIGARHLESVAQLEQLAARLGGDSGVDRILVIGGDREKPAGPYDSSLAVMQSAVFQKAGINRMAIAGFPEGHPSISDIALQEALAAKVAFAHSAGIQLSIVSQFCFKPEPIISWLQELRNQGIHNPVRVGLAGPAGLLTLTRYALRCGIGNSLHVLTEHPSFANLLAEKGPEPIIQGLANLARPAANGDLPLGIAGLHLFVFGGLSKTLDWITAQGRQ
jgi:methylenetetrahydrofolate reductase (NADPH)